MMLKNLPVYRALTDSIRDNMTLEELIDTFEKMCKLPVGTPDNLLFETGTFSFFGENMFYFSLVRQFQFADEDEYVQLHLDIQFPPSIKTAQLKRTTWWETAEDGFFEEVKNSQAFHCVKNATIAKIDVDIFET